MSPQLPQEFRRMLADAYPRQAEQVLYTLEHSEPTVAIRLNPHKPCLTSISLGEAIPWCEGGYWLDNRPLFAHDPHWHAGCYYVQDAASMAIATALHLLPRGPLCVLDLSAAPGGKSTLLAAQLPEGSTLVANEPIPKRASILAENLTKWGKAETIVIQAWPEELAHTQLLFDLIVVDAPCSGEGLFRKQPEARQEWSPDTVALCVTRQQQILQEAWRMLRPGGMLLYATCTFNPYENESQAARIIREYKARNLTDEIQPHEGWLRGGEGLGYHLMPGLCRGEGFYFIPLEKPIGSSPAECVKSSKGKSDTQKASLTRKDMEALLPFIEHPLSHDPLAWLRLRDCAHFVPGETARITTQLQRSGVRLLAAGIPVALLQGKAWQPHEFLPFAQCYARSFPSVSMNSQEALRYLSGEAIPYAGILRGYVTIHYEGVALGLAKAVHGRLNNLYPKPFRLRKVL